MKQKVDASTKMQMNMKAGFTIEEVEAAAQKKADAPNPFAELLNPANQINS